MREENKGILNPLYIFSIFSIIFLVNLINCVSTTESSFSPPVNYLIDCGSSNKTHLKDGRIFKSDRETTSLISSTEEIQISVDSININLPPSVSSSSLPLYQTARVFREESKYTFYISQTGRLWLRLYFFPLPNPSYNLTAAVFSVQTDQFVLLHDFSLTNSNSLVFKEYLVNVSNIRFSLKFKPKKNSFAFINAIEVVSAPGDLISDSATTVSPSSLGESKELLSKSALQVSYRVNVGGPNITPDNDTLSRTWESDVSYNVFPQGSEPIFVSNKTIKYPKTGVTVTPLIAPISVYATAVHMKDPRVLPPNFNLSWVMNVESSYSYLIRMHFCDIVSKSLNQLYFNVYINGIKSVSPLDLSTETKALATAYYKDFVLDESAITNGSIMVQVGPSSLLQGTANAILNGIEVMKISNSADSFDGFFNVDGKYIGPSQRYKVMKIVVIVGLTLAFIAMLFLVVIYIRWKKRPLDWEKNRRFSSWLLPLHLRCRKINTKTFDDSPKANKSKHGGHSAHHSPRGGHGRFFYFIELQRATQNFDDNKVIGVGGFGKVYHGTLEDGTQVAIKRGSSSSEQGINEFITELDMLSKLRHRHLVSLIGFCDENSEMILVYDYMANGPFRSHLYGTNLPPLSWQKRLEICIGAARGLHYLHTGATQSIIHRDVKTTNILLDENYVAKVADFGLSKALQDKSQVSTAVKGSFGYLDPEYFRSQQLTQKSDIYSFGVVLFEVLCARPVVSQTLPREQANLADWAMQQHKKGKLHKLIDPHIAHTIGPESFKTFVMVAEKCLADQGVDRPSMGDVLWHLEHSLQLQLAANSHIGIPIDKSTNSISFQHSNGNDKIQDNSCAVTNDDASDGYSDLFSQIANLQGR